jgi:hypothetical protein
MLVVLGATLLALGAVLVAAAAGLHRDAARRPRLARWVGGETAGVLLTMVPASGLVALLNVLIGQGDSDLGVLHIATAAAIAAAGWMATRAILRRFAHLEETDRAAGPTAGLRAVAASHQAAAPIADKRAA